MEQREEIGHSQEAQVCPGECVGPTHSSSEDNCTQFCRPTKWPPLFGKLVQVNEESSGRCIGVCVWRARMVFSVARCARPSVRRRRQSAARAPL